MEILLHPVNDISLTATAVDLDGFSITDEILIVINKNRRIYIPTVFSPNNDGINDIFSIWSDKRQISKIKKFVIYNRWGALVHEAKDFLPDDPAASWNSIDKNGNINPGVFVYEAEIGFVDGGIKTYTGDVTVAY